MHEWGAHYKYSDVPLGEWMKPLLHTNRNMYDRVAHFSFGLLLSYPLQEMFMRKAGVTGRWRYILPVEAILSFSAIYEIMEAGAAMILSSGTRRGVRGDARRYVGFPGRYAYGGDRRSGGGDHSGRDSAPPGGEGRGAGTEAVADVGRYPSCVGMPFAR